MIKVVFEFSSENDFQRINELIKDSSNSLFEFEGSKNQIISNEIDPTEEEATKRILIAAFKVFINKEIKLTDNVAMLNDIHFGEFTILSI